MTAAWNADTESFEDDGSDMPQIDSNQTQVDLTNPDDSEGNADRAALYSDKGYTGGSDADIARLIADAKASGVQPSFLDKVFSGAGSLGKTATDWISANPMLAKILGTGASTAQSQANARELLDRQNQYRIDAVNAANAHEQMLRDQRNASVTGTKTADLSNIGRGIINSAAYKR